MWSAGERSLKSIAKRSSMSYGFGWRSSRWLRARYHLPVIYLPRVERLVLFGRVIPCAFWSEPLEPLDFGASGKLFLGSARSRWKMLRERRSASRRWTVSSMSVSRTEA